MPMKPYGKKLPMTYPARPRAVPKSVRFKFPLALRATEVLKLGKSRPIGVDGAVVFKFVCV
jgi:hypothetical protein